MDDLVQELDSFDRATPEARDRRRRLIATAAICGLAFVGIGQLTTGALFEDSATASVSYATGNVAIEANGSAAATLPAVANMAPGDTTYRPLSVTNVGSLDLRYAVTGVTSSDTNALSTVLRYAVYSGVSTANCSAGNVAGGVVLASNLTIGTTSVPVLGNSANGAQPGDRSIAAGAGPDVLCVATTLPLATTSAFASSTAQVVLTFDAEQTRNN